MPKRLCTTMPSLFCTPAMPFAKRKTNAIRLRDLINLPLIPRLGLSRLLSPPLLSKYPPTHLQHRLEPLPPSLSILSKALHARLLNLRPYLLPPTTQRRDLRFLPEACLFRLCTGRYGGLVHDSLAHVEDFGPGEVRGGHGHAFGDGVDGGDFVHVRGVGAAENGENPGGSILGAGNEAFGAELLERV